MIDDDFGVPIPGRVLPESEWAKTALKRFPPPEPLDWAALFGRVAPVILELGCGNGRFTLESALARPDHDHFATDLLPVFIRYATRRANQRGLHNVRFGVRDAQTVMSAYVGAESVDEIHLYHPQPYHDPRSAHLRLITPRFLANVHRGLRPGGIFVVQTDNPDYWEYMTRVIPVFFELGEPLDAWPSPPEFRSRREILARSRGLRIFRAIGVRRQELSRSEAVKKAESMPSPTFRTRGPWIELDALEVGQNAPSAQRPRRP